MHDFVANKVSPGSKRTYAEISDPHVDQEDGSFLASEWPLTTSHANYFSQDQQDPDKFTQKDQIVHYQRYIQSSENILHKLSFRQLEPMGNALFKTDAAMIKFKDMNLRHELDVYGMPIHQQQHQHHQDATVATVHYRRAFQQLNHRLPLQQQQPAGSSITGGHPGVQENHFTQQQASPQPRFFARQRKRIIEILSTKDLIFALTANGVCAVFDRVTNKRICYMNTSEDEIVRSLFLNKANDSLITVSVFRADKYSSLKCSSTRLEYIRRRIPDQGFPLFESECLRWPGFVEFDDVNNKVLTYSAVDRSYKMWDMVNYKHLYTIREDRIEEIKISPGVILLIYQRSSGYVPLQVLNIETGKIVKQFKHLLRRNRKVHFIEHFNDKLLVKQENENLQIIDIRKQEVIEVSCSSFLTPSAFMFLYENNLFLTFRNHQVCVWNFKGEVVTEFDDHELWHSESNTNSIYITALKDFIISYCKTKGCDHGSINVSHIVSGKSVAKVTCVVDNPQQRLALEEISCLFYNEDRNEIYTGSKNGMVHVWANHK